MRYCGCLAWLLFVIAAVPVACTVSSAQEAPLISPANAGSADTLDKALPQAAWDAARQGALLVIDPQNTRCLPGQEALPPDTRPGASSLRALAARYGRQMIAAPSLTVLAPLSMTVLNARPGKPDPYAGLERWQKIYLLMGSLSSAQWRSLGNAEGLGMSDLTDAQQPLFLSLLPQPFALNSYKMAGGVKLSQHTMDITLSPEQRSGVRLRVNQATQMYLSQPNGQFGFHPDLQFYALPDQTDFFTLASHNVQTPTESYGVTLRSSVPNRLKPGQLDFQAPGMETPVAIEDIKTVDDLVKRIGQAVHRELYADGRVAPLSAVTRGRSARAGDLLQGLCLAVTGTVRRVGSAYVLTDDLEGIGSRHARLAEWAQEAHRQQVAALERAVGGVIKHPEQYIHSAPNDVFAFTPEDLQQLIARGPEPGTGFYDIPLASLPPGQQKVIDAFQEQRQEKPAGDHVKVHPATKYSYIVPGIGVVGEDDSSTATIGLPTPQPFSQPDPDARAALPLTLPTRALIVASANEQETARFAAQAKRHGFNQLWVEVAAGAEGKKRLAGAVEAGKANGLAIVAVIRLLQTPGGNPKDAPIPDALRDRNLLDETSSAYAARRLASLAGKGNAWEQQALSRTQDWLCADAPAVIGLLERQLRAIADMPGLSGLALTEAAAPGYQEIGDSVMPFEYTTANDYGYTPAQRLGFLRQAGYDPIDLAGGLNPAIISDLSLPFFPDVMAQFNFNGDTGQLEQKGARTPLQEWMAFRYQAASRLLATLHTSLRASYPNLPLLLRHDPVLEGWWAAWDKPEQRPRLQSGTQEKTAGQAAQVSARPLLLNIAYPGSLNPDKIPTSAVHLASWVTTRLSQRNKGWNGVTLDLRGLPSTTALTALEGLTAP